MRLETLLTAAEFRRYMKQAGADVSLAVVGMWRKRGLVGTRGQRGRSPLYRLGDLLEAEYVTRVQVQLGGGRRRGERSNRAA